MTTNISNDFPQIEHLTIQPMHDYWLASYDGEFSCSAMIKMGMTFVELFKQFPTRGLVFDVRDAKGELSMKGRYQLVNAMSPYWPKEMELALIIKESQLLKLMGFVFQKLSVKLGFSVSVHFSVLKAKQWMIERLHNQV